MINNNILSKNKFGILIIIILILSACATQPEREIIKSEPVKKVESILPLETIDRKISILEDLFTNNKVQEKDRVAVANLIYDYHSIKALSLGDPSLDDYREIILKLFNNLILFDEKYLLNQEKVTDEIYAKAINDLYIKKQSILKKYLSKDYKSVVSECSELEKTFGKDSMSYEIGILLAISLAKEGRLSEATALSDRIISEIEGRPDLIQLRSGLIEWQIDTGKKEKAFKEYQKLIEDMNNRQSIFDKTTIRINSQSKKIAESDQALNKLLDKGSNPDVNSRITGILKEIENLKRQGDYTGARLLLLKWKMRTDEPAEIVEINKALTSVDLSEKQYQEKLKTDKIEGIDAATKLIEEEDYESAITVLDNIKKVGESSPEIDRQKDIAIEKLINKERNRAAKIFLTAKKTTDTKKKKELLLSAQNILNGLIEKFPSSELTEKVKSNLGSVNDELRKIGN
jgi:outer membrane protein assembly factor BamD (BamD/ComL family)